MDLRPLAMAIAVEAAESQTLDVPVKGSCCKEYFPDDLPSQLEGVMSPEAYSRVMAEQTKNQRAYWSGPDTLLLTPLTLGVYLCAKTYWHERKMNKILAEHPDIPHNKVKIRYESRSAGDSSYDVIAITIFA